MALMPGIGASSFGDLLKAVPRLDASEEGHAGPLPGIFAAGAGAVMLGFGAANDTGWLAIAGGIVGGVGIVAAFVMNHMLVEYAIYRRLEDLEKK